jgi:integrase
MKTRGLGLVYQPKYKDRRTGETKVSAIWWIQYSARGKRIRESCGSTRESDGVRLLKKRHADAADGKVIIPRMDRTTLSDLLEILEGDYRVNGNRSLDRAQQAGAHLRAFFRDDCRAVNIGTAEITRYKTARLDHGAAPATVNYELSMLRRAFRLAKADGKVANRLEYKPLKVNNVRKGFFESDQFRAVLVHLSEPLKPVATAAYITGWRKRELLTRQWRHVDINAGWLRLEPGETKNGEGREFPFTPQLRMVLERQREYVSAIERRTSQIVPHVFCWPDGSPIKDFRGAWKKACAAAGVSGRLVHDFRRTAVRNLERAGVPRSAAMKLTGHRSESVYRRYAIVESGMLQEAVLKLDALHVSDENSQSTAKVATLATVK